jgi:hypothetical protein
MRWNLWSKNASKMMQPEEYVEVKRNEIAILCADTITRYFAVDDWKGTAMNEPWIKFYSWYFNEQSDCFLFVFEDREVMFRRCDIVSFRVKVTKREIVKPKINLK